MRWLYWIDGFDKSTDSMSSLIVKKMELEAWLRDKPYAPADLRREMQQRLAIINQQLNNQNDDSRNSRPTKHSRA